MTTIAQERAALTKVGRPLRTREQAGFKFKRYAETRSVSEPAPLVFVHITITNPKNYSSDDAHARAVEAIGISRFPNTGISYNRLLFQSGRAQEGQPMGRRGAHTVNDKNLTRCVSPGCPSKGEPIPSAATNLNNVVRAYAICQNVNDPVTAAQLDSLAKAIAADMLAGLVRRDADIHGHRCVAWKDCPASKMWALMGDLKRLVAKYVAAGVKPPTTPAKPPVQEDDMPYTEAEIKRMAGQGVHGQILGKSGPTIGVALEETLHNTRQMGLQIAGLTAAVQALAAKEDLDPAAITAAVDAAVEAALDDLKITLTVDDGDEPTKEG